MRAVRGELRGERWAGGGRLWSFLRWLGRTVEVIFPAGILGGISFASRSSSILGFHQSADPSWVGERILRCCLKPRGGGRSGSSSSTTVQREPKAGTSYHRIKGPCRRPPSCDRADHFASMRGVPGRWTRHTRSRICPFKCQQRTNSRSDARERTNARPAMGYPVG